MTPDELKARGLGPKPLGWDVVPSKDALCHDHWSAVALGGAYHMAPDEDSSAGAWLLQWTLRFDDFCMKYGGEITQHTSPEEAKAAAQADYEARIIAALEAVSDPILAAEVRGMERAAEICDRINNECGMEAGLGAACAQAIRSAAKELKP